MGWTCLNMLLLNWTTATKNNNTSIWTPRHSSWCRLFCITHCQHGGSNQSHPATVRVELLISSLGMRSSVQMPEGAGLREVSQPGSGNTAPYRHNWSTCVSRVTGCESPQSRTPQATCICHIASAESRASSFEEDGSPTAATWSTWVGHVGLFQPNQWDFWDFWMSYEILWVLFILSITFGTCIWHCSKPHHNAISEIYSFSKSPLPHCFHWVGWQNMLGGPRMVGLTEGWWEI